ncbi:DNA-3-methyladenine glycosylase I [Auritidibacter ignavus]|uniref:DNA-3-methyladenine glycosylase I n=1 Tax=Auritidibacter TaxID=1160973 RepID=UPI000D72C030|nr:MULTISPECIES: DNA-3-methyladenine glycosylase I [Auritidibacter]AXR73935.1 DNA-3-methyladenine glycosylase I [Auritidibacter sp. NML130574]PXA77283.1 3-methyladenine DNA glycosylase [Auritidibacter sp. NML100628]PXA80131.1 3-methyladenine DNA glycosylase [Auritidibacter sp. NML120636]WGH82644.1 DNA-3-methyladenine glycosylase I [Auritidibacter ignavus]
MDDSTSLGQGRGVIADAHGTARSPWAMSSQLMQDYYDTEWGVPITDEAGLFERISLEVFQTGLSWRTILTKRPAFRKAFCQFDPDEVATFDEDTVERLVRLDGIIRHRGKIRATIANAVATRALRDKGGLVQLVWSFHPETTPMPRTSDEVPTQSAESVALARALKKSGFRFVGPTNMFAMMEAIGMVDTHLLGSFRRGVSGLFDSQGNRMKRPWDETG